MKKILCTLVMLLMSFSMQAQIIKGDMNDDGNLTIEDVTSLVNVILNPASKTYIYSVEQFIADNKLTGEYIINGIKRYFDNGVEYQEPNLLPGKFSVSATKQVQFTKSNLYWDGSAYHFEENQTDYPTTWSTTHVGHFFWTCLTDYQTGSANYMPYASYYKYSSQSAIDKFWCSESSPLTVDGSSDLYTLSNGEWAYLIFKRTNASSLYKVNVTVGTTTNCMIIAPDDFTGNLKSSYTLDEINSVDLICLPPSVNRDGLIISDGIGGQYWSASSYSDYDSAYAMEFNDRYAYTSMNRYRLNGYAIRLVKTVSD